MAKKKKENTLSYLQMPLPQGGRYSKMTKVAFGGLNKRYTIDSGDLTMESNISTNEYPYLTPSNRKKSILNNYKTPISMFAFDDFLIVVYYKENKILVDYITFDKKKPDTVDVVHTGVLQADKDKAKATIDMPRSVVQFNVYDTPTDPVSGQFVKKLLFFPDKASMFMRIVEIEDVSTFDVETADTNVMYFRCDDNGDKIYSVVKTLQGENDENGKPTFYNVHELVESETIDEKTCFLCDGMDVLKKSFSSRKETDEDGVSVTVNTPPDTASHNYYYFNVDTNEMYRWVDDEADSDNSGWKVCVAPGMPDLKYATVHLSRVFGVDDDRVYASGYNDYTNWNLDTVDEYNESNAWCSPSQSNTKAGGNFTGITTFQNHVICFKRDFMHEIYNTKNPFRLQDIYAEGSIDNRTIQDVDGKLIFVSEDDVKIYTGSNPRIIGYNLNMSQYKYAVSGTDNRNYYLYCEDVSGKKYLYVYDTFTDLWSEQSIDSRVWSFAHNKNGMYMLCEEESGGVVYKMDTGDYSQQWSFETDLITNKTVDIKHIKKLQMLVDIPETINGVDNLADEKNSAYMKVYILYDDEEFDEIDNPDSRLVYSSNKSGKFPIRVKPRKTANYGFKLHFEGAGYIKIYELEIFVEAGGDMYV